MASSARLLALPPELQTAILSYIPRPTDLESICLSCKQLNDIATPLLYHTVYLEPVPTLKTGFLLKTNRGHAHVKEIAFVCKDLRQPSKHEDIESAIKALLELIPQNQLRGLSTPGALVLDPNTVGLIMQRQPLLQKIHLAPGLRFPATVTPSSFPHLNTLYMDCDTASKSALDLFRTLLEHRSTINTIGITADCYRQISLDEELRAKCLGAEPPSACILRYLLSSFLNDGAKKLTLKRLLLPADLRGSSKTLTQAIDFEQLESLMLHGCEGVSDLLKRLTPLFKAGSPKLTALSFSEMFSREDYISLGTFLKSFSALEYLDMEDRQGMSLFALSSLSNHLPTLCHLALAHGSNGGGATKPHRSMLYDHAQRVLTSATKLQQLALAFPSVDIRQHWRDQESHGYRLFVQLVSDLPNLEILHILTWPTAYGLNLHPLQYEGMMAIFATGVIQQVIKFNPESKLRILCFGDGREPELANREEPRDLKVRRLFFTRGQHVDSSGRSFAVASPIERHLVRYVHPMMDAISRISNRDRVVGANGYFRV